ncbi:hypothetical protein LTR53_012357 [Teratosphaeriaceae sp. CCFEE 6253]|nr:hypothetical protein LTR53_012357 [Teratosphaeriaceae sp. CCFEE 6253]
MDARIDTFNAFGIAVGDAHIIRNAGGNARDAYRSILISQHLLGTTEIILIKHTGCGMLTFSNEDARKVVNGHQGKEVCGPGFDFQPFGDLDAAVKGDVEWLRSSGGVVEGGVVSGWVYGVEDGKAQPQATRLWRASASRIDSNQVAAKLEAKLASAWQARQRA